MLTDEQKASLLALAREAVKARVLRQAPPSGTNARSGGPASPPIDLPAASGVFVTIKRAGALRGCLGTLDNRDGLAAEVVRCASDSASEDPRFPPVSADELGELRIELSVLGPLEPVDAVAEAFTIGVHGLVVEQGARRGLLLPQVATEWGWTPEQFLDHTCVKAGLRPDAWRRGAQVYRFSAVVFGD